MRAGILVRVVAAVAVAAGCALAGFGIADAGSMQAAHAQPRDDSHRPVHLAQVRDVGGPSDGSDEEEARAALEALLAEARSAASAAPLARNTVLDDIARAEAERMADAGAVPQSDPTSWFPDGAAAAVNAGVAESVLELHKEWLRSPEQRSTVLSAYTHVGIAVVVEDGETWAVEVFAAFSASETPLSDATTDAADAVPSTGASGTTRVAEGRTGRGFVPVPRESEPPVANITGGLSSLPAAVLTGSMAEDSATIGARIGMAAVLILAASTVMLKVVRRMRKRGMR